jgi:phosphoadenosine phosphosulfate reductase
MKSDIRLKELKDRLSDRPVNEQLGILASLFKGKIIFTTSFGIEDQVITHTIFANNLDIRVVTLDTGRLFAQTYDVFLNTNSRYGKKIVAYFPEYEAVEKMVAEKGPFSFYDSKENRLECCRIRKLIPLNRALERMECWISGIRAEQSNDRKKMDWIEYDEERNLFKFYPVYHWSMADVERFIKENNVPYNSLHNKGYISIGCEPCTRAVRDGQDFRSGRWWWETDGPKECGLHVK